MLHNDHINLDINVKRCILFIFRIELYILDL